MIYAQWRRKLTSCLMLAALLSGSGVVETSAALTGEWDRSEDGKYWIYCYSPGDPVTDEWIEVDGKEYYLDSKGYMKTGWVTDKSTGEKYYMGEDGAKCYNSFTPDGHYVGSDGVILAEFDTYRKAAKTALNKELSTSKKNSKTTEEGSLPGFVLTDLNWDGYPDLVVVDRVQDPERIVQISVWDSENQQFLIASEEEYESTKTSKIILDTSAKMTWLVTEEADSDRDYFVMSENDLYFENRWHFQTELDDWEDLKYEVDGCEVDFEQWNRSMAAAEEEVKTSEEISYIPLTAQNIIDEVDHIPTAEELLLWE